MKIFWQIFFITTLATISVSCGKKVHDNSTTRSINPETPESSATEKLINAIDANDLDLAKVAISEGADVDHTLSSGETLLTYTVIHDQRGMAKVLLDAGAIIEKRNKSGDAAIHLAVKQSNLDILKLLLAAGASIDATDATHNSALQLAILTKNEEICFFLISKKINLYNINDAGESALDIAKRIGFSKIFIYLTIMIQIDHGQVTSETLRLVIENGNLEALKAVIKINPALIKNPTEFDPLILAMKYSNHNIAVEMMEELMDSGCPLNGLKIDEIPLHFAIGIPDYDFVMFLTERNAELNNLDSNGKNTVIKAVEANNFEMVRLFRSRGGWKKYSATINGKKEHMNACQTARDVRNHLSDKDQIAINKKIRVELNCGWRIIFDLFNK